MTKTSKNEISIKEYIDLRFEENEKSVKIALESANNSILVARDTLEKGIIKAETALDKNTEKTERSAEKWRDNANEWRGAMNDREKQFLTRKEFYSIIVTTIAIITLIFSFWNQIHMLISK